MKILVTGGAGFIGSHLVDALLARGKEVHVVDNFSTGLKRNIPKGVKLWELDIRNPYIQTLIQREKYEVIYHQAAQLNLRKSVEEPIYDAEVNILGSLQVLEGATKAGTRLIIFASSGGTVYGEQLCFPASEDHPLQPISPYGVAKVTTEHHLYYYYVTYGLPYISLRYSNVYGPRQNPHGEAGVVAIFIERLLRSEPCIINGDGLQTRDYIYVQDVIEANILALEHHLANPDWIGTFNVGTGIETNVIQIYEEIQKNGFAEIPPSYGPPKKGEQRRSVISSERLKSQTGWKPQISLKEGIQKTVRWFRQNFHNNHNN
ncbi:MAG: GDP-mannose 4,6-dehydratase [Bacteroidia bacterium]|nr:GDP-mannose 4,6-dehydratase [Bacteroidia bacterium]MDW8157770.1 GDP-mannose 4,6-dehydratase [Bacteroidia bacterium]